MYFTFEKPSKTDEESKILLGFTNSPTTSRRRSLPLRAALVLALGLAVLALWKLPQLPELFQGRAGIDHSWAHYTPYFPVAKYMPVQDCEVIQVSILQRHGARLPITPDNERLRTIVAKLKKHKNDTAPEFKFLDDYTYDLGSEDLVWLGAMQSLQAGEETWLRYHHLVAHGNLPFVRASDFERVVLSAKNWTAGFASANQGRYVPRLSVKISEDGNNTLVDKMCPNAGDGSKQAHEWLSIYAPPIRKRVNAAAPGANLTDKDIHALISLCPLETAANWPRLSPFCELFSKGEYEAFEYYADLDTYYGSGYGQALGRVQGVGYVNELLARLAGRPVRDRTQTNRTLDSSRETFPLDRTVYADFSHDNIMLSIFSALGIFSQRKPLDPKSPDEARTWVVARMVPFSGRLVVEKMVCGRERKEYIRILVNDQVQPLEFCGAGAAGLCSLKSFVKSQKYARRNGEGDFEKCYK